jgi:hypothetical protein
MAKTTEKSGGGKPSSAADHTLGGVLDVPPLWLLGGDVADSEYDVDLDETADLASKVERLIKLHERTSQLLFEVQSEIRRLQSGIGSGAL